MAAGVVEQFANTASTTLNNGGTLTSGATSCTVTSATLFPSTGNFRILIGTEIIIVTAVSGSVFTLLRGQEGTSAASHADGSTVTHILTKGAVNAVQQARPVFTNTASSTYTMDSTGNPFDVLIIHNKSGAVSYVMPAPTAGRHIEVFDITGAINTLANNVFFVPHASEKFNSSSGFALTGTNYNFTNGSGTVTATGSKFQSELAVGMSIQSSNQTGVQYIVTAIASDLSLTISPTFGGTTTTTATATRTSLTFAANNGKLFFDSDGTDWYATGDGTPTILRYTASSGGTVAPFIPPQGVTSAQFRGCGGGGGGAAGTGNTVVVGGGGGGGAIQSFEEVAVTPMTNNAVTIGAGGNGASSGNGSAGGDTTVGSLVAFNGASGGYAASAATTNDSAGGLCCKAADGTNLYGLSYTTGAAPATITTYIMSLASGGGSHNGATAMGGARNIVGGFAGGTGAATGGGGGGGAGPRAAGGNGGTTGSSPGSGGSPAANTGAGGGGGGPNNNAASPVGAGGTGGSGYVDIIYVL